MRTLSIAALAGFSGLAAWAAPAAAQSVSIPAKLEGRNPGIWLDRLTTFTIGTDKKQTPITDYKQYKFYVGGEPPPDTATARHDWGLLQIDDRGHEGTSNGPPRYARHSARPIGGFCWQLTAAWLKKPLEEIKESGKTVGAKLTDTRFGDLENPADAATTVLAWIYEYDYPESCGLVGAKQVAWLTGKFPGAKVEDDLIARDKIRNRGTDGYAAGQKLFAATIDNTLGIYIVDKDFLVFYDPFTGPAVSRRDQFFSWAAPRSMDTFIVLP